MYFQRVCVLSLVTCLEIYTISHMDDDQLLQINYQSLPDNQVSVSYTDGTTELYADTTMLACGESIALNFAYDCYIVDSVWVNSVNVGAVTEWTVPSNLTDQAVRAFFSKKENSIHLAAGDGGRITPSGDTLVFCGYSLEITIVPDDCYQIESVLVDGVNIGAVTSHLFESVTEPHTVRCSSIRLQASL